MSPYQPRCIGLVGGLGPAATIYYYNALLRAHADLAAKADIVVVHADVTHVLRLVRDGDILGLARYHAGFIELLGAAGATLAAVAAVTPHISAPHLQELTPLPLVSIVDVIRDGLKQRGWKRIALFGTLFVIEMDLFGTLNDFEVIRPRGDELDIINAIYLELVASARASKAQADRLRTIAQEMMESERLDAIVLAGTELALMGDWQDLKPRILSSADLHVTELVRRAVAREG
ncbi:MAG: aspartate racemase [Alphaproteobacteria bacterium]|nr:aspartate racemase [Alphaproteobacteria bacterium]